MGDTDGIVEALQLDPTLNAEHDLFDYSVPPMSSFPMSSVFISPSFLVPGSVPVILRLPLDVDEPAPPADGSGRAAVVAHPNIRTHSEPELEHEVAPFVPTPPSPLFKTMQVQVPQTITVGEFKQKIKQVYPQFDGNVDLGFNQQNWVSDNTLLMETGLMGAYDSAGSLLWAIDESNLSLKDKVAALDSACAIVQKIAAGVQDVEELANVAVQGIQQEKRAGYMPTPEQQQARLARRASTAGAGSEPGSEPGEQQQQQQQQQQQAVTLVAATDGLAPEELLKCPSNLNIDAPDDTLQHASSNLNRNSSTLSKFNSTYSSAFMRRRSSNRSLPGATHAAGPTDGTLNRFPSNISWGFPPSTAGTSTYLTPPALLSALSDKLPILFPEETTAKLNELWGAPPPGQWPGESDNINILPGQALTHDHRIGLAHSYDSHSHSLSHSLSQPQAPPPPPQPTHPQQQPHPKQCHASDTDPFQSTIQEAIKQPATNGNLPATWLEDVMQQWEKKAQDEQHFDLDDDDDCDNDNDNDDDSDENDNEDDQILQQDRELDYYSHSDLNVESSTGGWPLGAQSSDVQGDEPVKKKRGRKRKNPELSEEQRKAIRMAKNRASAKKSRERKKAMTQNYSEKIDELSVQNTSLRDQVAAMKKRIAFLQNLLAVNIKKKIDTDVTPTEKQKDKPNMENTATEN